MKPKPNTYNMVKKTEEIRTSNLGSQTKIGEAGKMLQNFTKKKKK